MSEKPGRRRARAAPGL